MHKLRGQHLEGGGRVVAFAPWVLVLNRGHLTLCLGPVILWPVGVIDTSCQETPFWSFIPVVIGPGVTVPLHA